MTYNFDADRWYDRERNVLEVKHSRGELDAAAFAAALEDLDRRYEEITARLDSPFELP